MPHTTDDKCTHQIEILKKIRDEIKFETVEDLKIQIEKDINYIKGR